MNTLMIICAALCVICIIGSIYVIGSILKSWYGDNTNVTDEELEYKREIRNIISSVTGGLLTVIVAVIVFTSIH